MDGYTVLDQAVDLLRQRGRVTYRALKLQFQLDGMATPAAFHVIGHLSARDWGSVQACLTRALAIPEPPNL
jgi:hypothetical protein